MRFNFKTIPTASKKEQKLQFENQLELEDDCNELGRKYGKSYKLYITQC